MANRRATSRPTVERSIYFYRADAGQDGTGAPLDFDPAPYLWHLEGLPFAANGRYWEQRDGKTTCAWIDSNRSSQRMRLVNIRRSGLPALERTGSLTTLQIPADSGLAEEIHIVFFSNNIVGAEFNFYGPRLSKLGSYFAEKVPGQPRVSFEPLLRRDILAEIDRLADIRLFRLKIHRSYVAAVAQADQSLGRAFRAAAEAGDAQELEIVLRPERYARGASARLAQGLLSVARRLAGRDDLRENTRSFVIKGEDRETDRVEAIDILSDQLITKKQLVRQGPRTRRVDSGSAYRAIREAYTELENEFLSAAGVEQ